MEHEVLHGVAELAEQEAFYQDPVFWVTISFLVFMAIALKPLVKAFTKTLDARSAQIAAELAEARRLRVEAEEVLASYQKKQRESLQEAEAMLASTRADAASIVEKAEADLKISMEKRLKMAYDKIAQAETRAVQDVQGYVADIALISAEKLIAEHMKSGGNDELVKKASADVASKIH